MSEANPEVVHVEPYAVRRQTAAKLLDCAPSTIYKLCKEGALQTVKVGADVRVLYSSIKALGKA
jgi:excisionase family DNA binding protein